MIWRPMFVNRLGLRHIPPSIDSDLPIYVHEDFVNEIDDTTDRVCVFRNTLTKPACQFITDPLFGKYSIDFTIPNDLGIAVVIVTKYRITVFVVSDSIEHQMKFYKWANEQSELFKENLSENEPHPHVLVHINSDGVCIPLVSNIDAFLGMLLHDNLDMGGALIKFASKAWTKFTFYKTMGSWWRIFNNRLERQYTAL